MRLAAIHEVVGEAMAKEIECGAPRETCRDDVAEIHGVSGTKQPGRKHGVRVAGVAPDHDKGPRSQVMGAGNVEPQSNSDGSGLDDLSDPPLLHGVVGTQ